MSDYRSLRDALDRNEIDLEVMFSEDPRQIPWSEMERLVRREPSWLFVARQIGPEPFVALACAVAVMIVWSFA